MTIENYQSQVDQWIKSFGVRYFDEMTNTVLLMEELGEFSRLMARVYGEQSFKQKEEQQQVKAKIKDEMADIFFVLTCLANQMDVNLTEAIEENFKKKTERDHTRHKSNEKLT